MAARARRATRHRQGPAHLAETVSRVEQYRERYQIIDPDRALGPEPRHVDLEQRRHHRAAHQAIERLHERQRTMVNDGATGTSAPTPTSHAPDPAEPISLAQPELMSATRRP